MKRIAFAIVVFVWFIYANLRHGSDQDQKKTWFDEMTSSSSAPQHAPAQPGSPKVAKAKPSNIPPQAELKAETRPETKKEPKVEPAPSLAKQIAPPSKTAAGPKLVCKRQGEPVRSLLISAQRRGCELIYAKPESTETVARSVKSMQPCEKVRAKIARKLEAAGYRCEDAG